MIAAFQQKKFKGMFIFHRSQPKNLLSSEKKKNNNKRIPYYCSIDNKYKINLFNKNEKWKKYSKYCWRTEIPIIRAIRHRVRFCSNLFVGSCDKFPNTHSRKKISHVIYGNPLNKIREYKKCVLIHYSVQD